MAVFLAQFSIPARGGGGRGEFGLTEEHLALVDFFFLSLAQGWTGIGCQHPVAPLPPSAYDSELSGGCLRGAGIGAVRATQQLPCPLDRGRKHEGLAGSQGLTASPPPSIS